jgi:hypothetical protein
MLDSLKADLVKEKAGYSAETARIAYAKEARLMF